MTDCIATPVGGGEAQALDADDSFSRDAVPDAVREWIQGLRAAIAEGRLAAQELSDRLESLAHRATTLAHEMDFALLFDPATRLFHLGYKPSADRIDHHPYYLLASEARLASFFPIPTTPKTVE